MTKWVACLLYKGYQVFLFTDKIEKDYILGKKIQKCWKP